MINPSRLSVSMQRLPTRWIPLLLLALAIGDLRTEFILLIDHFTVTGFSYAVYHHQLAIAVLLSSVSLWRRYGG
ncbi:hypothetical protein [Synechococcus sp. M16CYN]|uniref:hypothetical protein n=1 Tax=Synechococcus sp. M16CYN TaxID=3103139 RepID=UPI0030E26285